MSNRKTRKQKQKSQQRMQKDRKTQIKELQELKEKAALLEKKKFAIANFLKLKIWKKDYGKRKLV